MTLPSLHTAIATLLARGLPADEVDVHFERPDRRWVEAVARPTLNLFLFDLAEIAEYRNAGAHVTRNGNHAEKRPPPRRFDLRFLVTAFAAAAEDEHTLLWNALAALLKYATLPLDEVWPGKARPATAIPTRLGPYQDAPRTLDIWGALDVPHRPALLYTVTMPLDIDEVIKAPLVLTRATRFAQAQPRPQPGPPPDPRFRWPQDKAAPAPITPSDALRGDWQEQWRIPMDKVVIDSEHGGLAHSPDGLRFEIAGITRDRQGKPLEAVEVGVVGRAIIAETDKDGVYKLANLRAGDRLWARRAPGDDPLPQPITVPADRYDIELD